MKVALTCDHIIERSHVTEIFESLLGLFENAEIYTLAHNEKGVLGPIELRKIHSTYLSRFIKSPDRFMKNSYLIPGAAQSLFVPCSVDLIVNISTGFSHGIKKCDKTKQITYLYDNEIESRHPIRLREKFFRSYVLNWSRNKLKQADELWVSSESLKDSCEDIHPNAKVVSPFFKVTDFPIFPENMTKSFPHDFYAVNSDGLSPEMARALVKIFEKHQTKFKFVGPDEHLNELKSGENDPHFYGKRCSGELAPMLAAARGMIDLTNSAFPSMALSSLATGRPVIVQGNRRNHDFLNDEGVLFVDGLNGLEKELENLNRNHENYDAKKLRAQAMKYHDVKFKSFVKRQVEQLFN